MSEVQLKQIGDTALYKPVEVGDLEAMLFLLGNPKATPGEFISLDDIWSATGNPKFPGYLVFLISLQNEAVSLEKALRQVLPKMPTTTMMVWTDYQEEKGEQGVATIRTLLSTELNPGNEPVLAGDVTFKLPPGMNDVHLGARAPVLSGLDADAHLTSLLVTYPPGQDFPTPDGKGVCFPLSGNSVGCLQFQGLIALQPPPPEQYPIEVTLADVQIDPFRPLNGKRTHKTYTGQNYEIVKQADGLHLIPEA